MDPQILMALATQRRVDHLARAARPRVARPERGRTSAAPPAPSLPERLTALARRARLGGAPAPCATS
jgi:hypothetical protein